jgi:hypothetical protein
MRFLWGEAGAPAVRRDTELKRFYRGKVIQNGFGMASVAVARKLAIRLWIMLRDQRDTAFIRTWAPGGSDKARQLKMRQLSPYFACADSRQRRRMRLLQERQIKSSPTSSTHGSELEAGKAAPQRKGEHDEQQHHWNESFDYGHSVCDFADALFTSCRIACGERDCGLSRGRWRPIYLSLFWCRAQRGTTHKYHHNNLRNVHRSRCNRRSAKSTDYRDSRSGASRPGRQSPQLWRRSGN